MTLSYFTGEQHSVSYKPIIQLAEELGFSVMVYESKESNQFDFLQAVYRDTATIVDATIPDDLTKSTVYPVLTAHINSLNHILVFSDNQYEDGGQILPLNITPQRVRTKEKKDLIAWLREQLENLRDHQYYDRFEIESIDRLATYKSLMENVLSKSLDIQKSEMDSKTRVMISYRTSCAEEVEQFRRSEATKRENVEIEYLSSGSLCDDYEALTPMRRWMLVGLLEDYIRNKNEVWVYFNNIYPRSWWTLAEMVMVAYINYGRAEKDKVQLKVYDAQNKRFMDRSENGYPEYLHLQLSENQHQELARYLSNTRPDTMGPEMLSSIKGLKRLAWAMRLMTKKTRTLFLEQMRKMIEMAIPNVFLKEDSNIVNKILAMYSNPKDIIAYTKEAVFRDAFWENISYQTEPVTPAFKDVSIDVDTFINTPMLELTRYKDKKLQSAVTCEKAEVKLKGRTYYVVEGKKHFLWLATRSMNMPTIQEAPGIKVLQTYKLYSRD